MIWYASGDVAQPPRLGIAAHDVHLFKSVGLIGSMSLTRQQHSESAAEFGHVILEQLPVQVPWFYPQAE